MKETLEQKVQRERGFSTKLNGSIGKSFTDGDRDKSVVFESMF